MARSLRFAVLCFPAVFCLAIGLPLASLAAGADNGRVLPETITLTASSSKVTGTTSMFFKGQVECDAHSDIFFNVGVMPNDSVIFELLADGSHETYSLVGDDARDNYFAAYRVDSSGVVYILTGNKQNQPVLFRLRNNVSSPARTTLAAPPGMGALSVRSFIELRDGNFLLQGYWEEGADKKKQGHGYLAEFDSSGSLIRSTTDKDALGFPTSDWMNGASAVEAEDGSIYLLGANKVTVLSQAGEVTKTIRLTAPNPSFRPFEMHLAGQRLEVSSTIRICLPRGLINPYCLWTSAT